MPSDFIKYLLSSEVSFAQSICLAYTRKRKTNNARPFILLILLPLYLLTKLHYREICNKKIENLTERCFDQFRAVSEFYFFFFNPLFFFKSAKPLSMLGLFGSLNAGGLL